MPIPSEKRKKFYSRAAGWPVVRSRIRARGGGTFTKRGRYLENARCEWCDVPDRIEVFRWDEAPRWWITLDGEIHDEIGQLVRLIDVPELEECKDELRKVKIVLTVAHLNQDPADNRDENLALLCHACHNGHDGPVRAAHATETRITKKDAARPLLCRL